MAGVPMGIGTALAELLEMVARSPQFDLIIAGLAEENPFPEKLWSSLISKQIEAIINTSRDQLKPLVAVVSGGKVTSDQSDVWRWEFLAEQRARLAAAQIPTYSTVAEAAKAVRQFIDYWQAKAEA